MEKCTYCIQRIEGAKITARKEGRTIEDGDVVTACQSACPTTAITFGNLADENSVVHKQHNNPRSYGMLTQLNLKPRTEYLARVRNTPKRLMTAKQIDDLNNLKPPHHHEGGHGSEDHHDDGHHGDDSHADDNTHQDESAAAH
jgi:molybdopterin-containing oxidoreductase family iron-sulfur binding subunit